MISGRSGAFRMTPWEPRDRTPSSVATRSSTAQVSRKWNRDRTAAGRSEGSSASRASRTAGEPLRGLHHDVDHECAAGQPQLCALPVQVGDGLLHFSDGARTHPAAVVEHPVDGALAQACTAISRMRYGWPTATPGGFWRVSGIDSAVSNSRLTSIDRHRTPVARAPFGSHPTTALDPLCPRRAGSTARTFNQVRATPAGRDHSRRKPRWT